MGSSPEVAGEKISKPSFETWLKPTKLIEIHEESKHAIISVQNSIERDWVDSRYKVFLEELLFEVTHTKYSINITMNEENTGNLTETTPLSTSSNRVLLEKLLKEQKRTNELL